MFSFRARLTQRTIEAFEKNETQISQFPLLSFRLSIPPFVKARTVLEGLESKDVSDDDQKPTKEEIIDTEVRGPY